MMFNIFGASSYLTAQRVFTTNTWALNTSMERLATGRRINRGSDDPAGLIASTKLGAVLKGLEAEVRSMQRADHVANVAEGALSSTADQLSDANALAVSAANTAGMSDEERQALQMQMDSILATVDRTATNTTFNGDPLLNGTATISAGGSSLDLDSASTGNLGEVEIDGETYTLADVGSGGALNLVDGDAEKAQFVIRAAISDVATARGELGSFQRHSLGAGIENAQTNIINTAAAQSQIMDTDYAEETMKMNRAMVLQQASLGALQMFASMQNSILALFDR
ncbi:MAG: flagellin [Planctomycetota bacterium]|jgi:flagellin